MLKSWTCKSLGALLAVIASVAAAGQPASRGGVPGAVSRAWMVLDEGGGDRLTEGFPTLDAGGWAAAVRVAARAPFDEDAAGALELISGERLPGRLESVGGGEIAWRADRFGVVRAGVDEVAAVTLAPGARLGNRAGAVLANGDFVAGAVELARGEVVIRGSLGETALPMERVVGVRWRAARDDHGGLRVWLRDGGVVHAAEAVGVEGGRGVRVERADGSAGLFRADEALAVTRGGAWVRGLGAPAEVSGGVEARGRSVTARAPAVARWEIAEGVVALAGSARAPADSGAKWSDALVSVWAGTALAFSARTGAERPAAALASRVERGAGEVTLSVQGGARGAANGVAVVSLVAVGAP